jgi:tetratricopeptide (TPR) repeat protein
LTSGVGIGESATTPEQSVHKQYLSDVTSVSLGGLLGTSAALVACLSIGATNGNLAEIAAAILVGLAVGTVVDVTATRFRERVVSTAVGAAIGSCVAFLASRMAEGFLASSLLGGEVGAALGIISGTGVGAGLSFASFAVRPKVFDAAIPIGMVTGATTGSAIGAAIGGVVARTICDAACPTAGLLRTEAAGIAVGTICGLIAGLYLGAMLAGFVSVMTVLTGPAKGLAVVGARNASAGAALLVLAGGTSGVVTGSLCALAGAALARIFLPSLIGPIAAGFLGIGFAVVLGVLVGGFVALRIGHWLLPKAIDQGFADRFWRGDSVMVSDVRERTSVMTEGMRAPIDRAAIRASRHFALAWWTGGGTGVVVGAALGIASSANQQLLPLAARIAVIGAAGFPIGAVVGTHLARARAMNVENMTSPFMTTIGRASSASTDVLWGGVAGALLGWAFGVAGIIIVAGHQAAFPPVQADAVGLMIGLPVGFGLTPLFVSGIRGYRIRFRDRAWERVVTGRPRTILVSQRPTDKKVTEIWEMVLGCRYREAIEAAATLAPTELEVHQASQLAASVWWATTGAEDEPDIQLLGCDIVIAFRRTILEGSPVGALQVELLKSAMLERVWALINLERFGQAGEACEELIAEVGDSRDLDDTRLLAVGLSVSALMKDSQDDTQGAIAVYERLVRRFGHASELDLKVLVAKALVNAGEAHVKAGHSREGIAKFDEVGRRFGASHEPELHELVGTALLNKGDVLGGRNRHAAAMTAYDEIILRNRTSRAEGPLGQLCEALIFKGDELCSLGRTSPGLAAYQEVVARIGHHRSPILRLLVVRARFHRARALNKAMQTAACLAAYDEVVRRHGSDADTSVRVLVGDSLFNRALVLQNLGLFEASSSAWQMIEARYRTDSIGSLRRLSVQALSNQGAALIECKRYELAVNVLDRLIRIGDADRSLESRRRIARAFLRKAQALHLVGQRGEELATYDELIRRFRNDRAVAVREQVALALLRKGLGLQADGRPGEAASVWRLAEVHLAGSPNIRHRALLAEARKYLDGEARATR